MRVLLEILLLEMKVISLLLKVRVGILVKMMKSKRRKMKKINMLIIDPLKFSHRKKVLRKSKNKNKIMTKRTKKRKKNSMKSSDNKKRKMNKMNKMKTKIRNLNSKQRRMLKLNKKQ